MRSRESLHHVLWPWLSGRWYFALLGNHGYSRAILARTLPALRHCLEKAIVHQAWKVEGSPQVIEVVAPDAALRASFVASHTETEREHIRGWIGRQVELYVGAKGCLPNGFTRLDDEDASEWEDRLLVNGDWVGWVGVGDLVTQFGAGWEPYPVSLPLPGEGPSRAASAEGKGEVFAVYGGWGGYPNTSLALCSVTVAPATVTRGEAPRFFYVDLGPANVDVSGFLHEWRRLQAEKDARREAEYQERHKAIEAEAEVARRCAVELFDGPAERSTR